MLQTLPCCRATIRPISPRRQDLRYDEGPFLRRLPEHILQKPKDSQPANLPRHAVASYDCPKSRLTSARTAVECIFATPWSVLARGRCAALICTPITPAFAIDTRSSVDGSACGATAFLATVNDSSAASWSRLGPHECFQSDAHSISLPKLAFVCWHCKPSALQRRHRNYNTTHGEYTDSARG